MSLSHSAWESRVLHGNDKKRIKSALNDKKRNIFQTLVTTATVFMLVGTVLHLKALKKIDNKQ